MRKKSASEGGSGTKAGRVLIFFTHFPLETPFLKAAVRPRSLPLSPCLTAESRSLPHCWRWPPFTDPQPRECVPTICYFRRHFFLRTEKKKQLVSVSGASVWDTSEWEQSNRDQIHADILQLQMHIYKWRGGCTAFCLMPYYSNNLNTSRIVCTHVKIFPTKI